MGYENASMNIQWYPGHMTKARRMITENIKLIDAVCEIVDSRIPVSSRNPELDEMTGAKPRLIIFNRVDQADPSASKAWVANLKQTGAVVLETDCKSGKGVGGFASAVRVLLAEKISYYSSRGQTGRPLRLMVAGIPNVGKSSFINRVAGRKATAASDKPGVTRGKQWIGIDSGIELLDTPGVLWPKFEDQTIAENLAFTGAVRDDIMDIETLGAKLMLRMKVHYPERIAERYKLTFENEEGGFDLLVKAAKNRGFLLPGGNFDTERMAAVLLDEFRGGKLGRITLETAAKDQAGGTS